MNGDKLHHLNKIGRDRSPVARGLFGRAMPHVEGIPVLTTRTINGVRHVEPMLFWRRG